MDSPHNHDEPQARGRDEPKKNARRYQCVTETLRQRLAEGSWRPGDKLPTLRDLASEFKVSTNTVRSAIRVLEREGHLHHIHAVGTFVRPAFPTQTSTRQTTIGLVIPDIGGPFAMFVARGVEQACQARSWGLQIYDDRRNPQLEVDNLARLATSGAVGAVILPTCDAVAIESLFKLKLSGFPFVLVDRRVRGLNVDSVESDHEKGAHMATEYLLQQGHRRIMIVMYPPDISPVEARLRGYERALVNCGLVPLPEWRVVLEPPGPISEGEEFEPWAPACQAVRPVLQKVELPVGIFGLNEFITWGVLEACRELGLRVPQDVSVVCFDNSVISRAMSPPMTAVAQRDTELGRCAVGLLERRLNSPGIEPQQVVLQVELIKRQSVAPVTCG